MNSIEQINSENGMASQWGLLREISPREGANKWVVPSPSTHCHI